jgi:hypothetical protein
MNRGYLVVEGHGEIRAALNLVTRLWQNLALDPQLHWSDPPIRGQALNTREGITRACRLIRTKRDAAALLVLRDADDEVDCPKTCGRRLPSGFAPRNSRFRRPSCCFAASSRPCSYPASAGWQADHYGMIGVSSERV